jgi:hypothetical protein
MTVKGEPTQASPESQLVPAVLPTISTRSTAGLPNPTLAYSAAKTPRWTTTLSAIPSRVAQGS